MDEFWVEEMLLAEYEAGWRCRAMAVSGMERQASKI